MTESCTFSRIVAVSTSHYSGPEKALVPLLPSATHVYSEPAGVRHVKIIGAGSIGTHHAHASRRLGWHVTVVDVDLAALERMRTQLFPSRYGSWDDGIRLVPSASAPRGGFDLIIVGTPPDSHVPLSLSALDENPAAILIEKPLSPPLDARLGQLEEKAKSVRTRLFVGYDHAVGQAAEMVERELTNGAVGAVLTIDVEFREHWAGIFAAHPWLSGPADSYLGFAERGGGASGEHSHAINLWQHFARVSGAGSVVEVRAALDYVTDGSARYDRLCFLTLRTQTGLLGRVVQDVVTQPPRKWARVQGTTGAIEWHVGYQPGADAVIVRRTGEPEELRVIAKTRPDDFIRELQHIDRCCVEQRQSPLDLARGLDTMRVIAAAHESDRSGRAVQVSCGAPVSSQAAS